MVHTVIIKAMIRKFKFHCGYSGVRSAQRLALLGIIFFIATTLTVADLLYKVPHAQAVQEFSIKTGYYLGSGSTLSVTGLGFEPQLVIIKADSTAGSMVWKSSAMPASVTAYTGVATADNNETEIVLDDDGFTVSVAAEVNTANTRYVYIAFAGSDCTSNGTMCIGSYTGNSATTQDITTGFQPDLVFAKRTTALAATFRTSSMSTNHAGLFSATANDTTGIYFQTLNSDGFTVGSTNNTNGGVYYYAAFKGLTGKLAVGQFTGDGVDNKEITGVGFEPDFVFVKQNSAVVPAFNTTEMWGDYSSFTTAAAPAVNSIQELKADGFQVGNSTSVNANTIVSYYFAFGGAPDPSVSDSFLMQRGSYTGTGIAQEIETDFPPDLVIIKGNTTEYGVFSTSLIKDLTHYLAVATAGFTGGITSMDNDGFMIGTHSTVNSNGINYEWIAFGNATSPHKGGGAADFAIGALIGNAATSRSIDHIGISPNLAVSKRHTGTAALAVWSSSAMATNTSAHFSATADVTDGTSFRTFGSGGFTVGSGTMVNAAAVPYVWFAFKEGDNFDVGSYTGSGSSGKDVKGLGFDPDFVWIKRSTAVSAVHRSTSATITGSNSQYFLNLANAANFIIGFVTDGFTIGSATEVNANGGAYQYAAWNSSASANPPNTPTNSTPTDAATGQDLRLTLTGSAYSDPETDSQTNAQWQVDDDSDFASPVWTRTANTGETSTSVTSGNGTFANELAGKTELDHNSTYYWRVRYSDGVWSSWSSGTSFVTNVIVTPSNTSPADGGTVTTLTPTLSVSSFSDPQTGHTAESAQWLISSSESFSSTLYDSGEVAYSNSHAVPSATLSDKSVYYWKVRYKDSSDEWTSYSTPTRFLVSVSPIFVAPLFGQTVVDQGDDVNIDVQVKLTDGTIINTGDATITIFDPAGTKIVDEDEIDHIAGSSGIYRYPYTIPSANGSYLYEVTVTNDDKTGVGAANFEVRTISGDISDIKTTTNNILTNVDILIGGLIVVQSTVQDASPTTTSFDTGLSNTESDFYKNGTLVFTSGDLDGVARRISAYNGSTKVVTVDPALPSAPVDGTSFTITSQNLRSQEQLLGVDTKLNTIEGKIDSVASNVSTVLTNLSTIEANLSTVQTTLNTLRASQQKQFDVSMTDADSVPTTGKYRATVTLRNFESAPVNANSVPRITIYDPDRSEIVSDDTLTPESAGVYSYEYEIPDDATGGVWESRVSIDPDGEGDLILSDIWNLSGSAAEVVINDITDTTIPTITANTTITNEGGSDQEYNYTWCVVSSESNQCGGGDDVYVSSAAKLLVPGQSFTTDLSATVSTVGTYWFKVSVNWGSGTSGAAVQFDATSEDDSEIDVESSSGGSGQRVSLSTITRDISSLKELITADSQKLEKSLKILGNVNPDTPGFRSLLDISSGNFDNLRDVQNKITDIRTISSAIRQITQGGSGVKINQFLEWGSVKFGFLISNSVDVEQTIEFKSFLPEEVRPEHVLDLDGLQIDFDPTAGTYYVHGSITLGPQSSVVKKVRVQDVWIIDEKNLDTLKVQAKELADILQKSSYEGTGSLIANDIENTVNVIELRQKETLEPQIHILNYRENKLRLQRIDQNMEKLRSLVAEVEASRGIFGRLSGIQLTSTWGIILAIVFGFGLLAFIIFAMWRNQMKLAMSIMKERERQNEQERPVEVVSGVVREGKTVAKKTQRKTTRKIKVSK